MSRFVSAVALCLGLSGCLGLGNSGGGAGQADLPGAPDPVEAAVRQAVADAPPVPATQAEETALAQVLSAPPKDTRGLFGRVFGKPKPADPEIRVTDAQTLSPKVAVTATQDGTASEALVAEVVDEVAPPAPEGAVEPPRKGLFGFFARKGAPASEAEPETPEPPVVAVAVVPDEMPSDAAKAPPTDLVEPEKRRGLLGGLFGRASPEPAPEQEDATQDPVAVASASAAVGPRKSLAPGAPVFGRLTPACGVSNRAMGKQIDRAPATGKVRYRLFDTDPGALGQREFYVTGFKDKCPRVMLASVAVFGDLGLYEVMTFGGGAPGRKAAATDKAYRKLRLSACGGSRKGPCSSKGTDTLSRQVAFLSVYPRKGASTHLEVLLNKGTIEAQAMR